MTAHILSTFVFEFKKMFFDRVKIKLSRKRFSIAIGMKTLNTSLLYTTLKYYVLAHIKNLPKGSAMACMYRTACVFLYSTKVCIVFHYTYTV